MPPWRLATALAGGLALTASGAAAQSIEALRGLSIEQLGQVQVTSVSKSPEAVSDAPAAIYVITHDDIIRSGVATVPEMLRLAPNLEVAQLNSSSYAISARGLNVGDNASLSNKLLVLVDGRSVYSPMFGGVYWDMLDIPPENIDHIEVISGPGATLWGANAVNGVINIITRGSDQTQGGVLTMAAGNVERYANVQYGGRLTPDLTYRVNADITNLSSFKYPGGPNADDGWYRPTGGFRLDWTPSNDTLSAQGDLLSATENPGGYVKERDLVGNWTHRFDDGSSLQLLTYYDDSERYESGGAGFALNTYDIELQHNLKVGGWNDVVWGIGERNFDYHFFSNGTPLALSPVRQDLNLANIFGQDTISLSRGLKLTLGVKLEDEPYAGVQAMPSIRLAWNVTDSVLLWSAVSRALRSPTPVDTNLREYFHGVDTLNGSTGFRPETLTAYEVGTRVEISPRASVSLSAYYDVYDDLRSINASPTPAGTPFVFGNAMAGHVYGLEAWGTYQLADWWRISAGVNVLHDDLRFLPGALRGVGLAFTANDPHQQASLHSAMDLGGGVTLDGFLREVGELHHPQVPGYVELDARLGWNVNKWLQASLSGFNLLHAEHEEFLEPGLTTDIPRSVLAQTRVRF